MTASVGSLHVPLPAWDREYGSGLGHLVHYSFDVTQNMPLFFEIPIIFIIQYISENLV